MYSRFKINMWVKEAQRMSMNWRDQADRGPNRAMVGSFLDDAERWGRPGW